MRLAPRVVLGSVMWIATSCALAYDVDAITASEDDCGEENAACCAKNECNSDALTCVGGRCERCAVENGACCAREKLTDCSGDAGAVLSGICSFVNGELECTHPCSPSSSACALLPLASCCSAGTPSCGICSDDSCLCKVCCAKCGDNPYEPIDTNAGEACSQRAMAYCGESFVEGHWSPTGC